MVGGVGEAGGDFKGVFGEDGGEVVGWGRWGEKWGSVCVRGCEGWYTKKMDNNEIIEHILDVKYLSRSYW